MKISFHGAARTVTGSKHLLHLQNGKKVLLDCGLFQGMGKETYDLNKEFGFEASQIDALILSHAHIDHSGLIPKLVKEGFRGSIFCTHGSKDLAGILLEDSGEIQESDIKFINKRRAERNQPLYKPLYTAEDARNTAKHFVPVEFNSWTDVCDGLQVMFTDAGHIIGSACVNLKIKETDRDFTLTFSGDLGRYRDVILKSPEVFPQADYIVMESTYGNSLHDLHDTTPDAVLQWINKICIKKGGKLIMPAFSVGRTQEILFALNQLELENRLPDIEYYVDSPLSMEATEIVKSYPNYFNDYIQKIMEKDSDPFDFKGLRYIKSMEQSKAINYNNNPMVIISASGMADAGRVKHHIANNVENSKNGILLTGYCTPNSLGARLQSGNKEVNIFGLDHEVNAEIGAIRSMSAHGDYADMTQWLACQNKELIKKLFLVHGEYAVQQDFKKILTDKGIKQIEIPYQHQEFEI